MPNIYLAEDHQWGDAKNLLIGEFTDEEWHEIFPEFYAAGRGDPRYNFFASLPQVVNLDEIDSEQFHLPTGIVGFVCATCVETDHLQCSGNDNCFCCQKTKGKWVATQATALPFYEQPYQPVDIQVTFTAPLHAD